MRRKGSIMADLKWFRSGDIFMIGDDKPQNRMDVLPGGNYLLSYNQELGFYLKLAPKFTLPGKLYGNIRKRAERIINTFQDRPYTTGVLLTGEKGSGKTLLTKTISNIAAHELEIPTIIINQPFIGDDFNVYLQLIKQPCILLFDEFEKVYSKEAQPSLLTMLDGVFTSKKLILMTANDFSAVDSHMKNRPGRMYYSLEFDGLGMDFVIEYGQEKLNDQKYLKALTIVAAMVKPLNFDVLQSLVEESNRYDESPFDSLDLLNVVTSKHGEVLKSNLKIEGHKDVVLIDSMARATPFNKVSIGYYLSKEDEAADLAGVAGDHQKWAVFYPNDLKSLDVTTGSYEYVKDGMTLKLTRPEAEDTKKDFRKLEHLT